MPIDSRLFPFITLKVKYRCPHCGKKPSLKGLIKYIKEGFKQENLDSLYNEPDTIIRDTVEFKCYSCNENNIMFYKIIHEVEKNRLKTEVI